MANEISNALLWCLAGLGRQGQCYDEEGEADVEEARPTEWLCGQSEWGADEHQRQFDGQMNRYFPFLPFARKPCTPSL